MLLEVMPLANLTMYHSLGTGGWLLMMLGMVVVWGLIIFGVIQLVHRVSGAETQEGADPLVVLDRRLAEGQVSAEDYDRRRSLLGGKS